MSIDINTLGIETLQHMGLEVLEHTPNRLRVKMPLEGNRNHLGGMYAGAIFTLAEFPFGLMFAAKFGLDEMVPVIGQMSIRYQAPATGPLFVDVKVTDEEWDSIQQQTREKGKLKLEREVEIRDEQGNLNSLVQGTYFSLLLEKK